MLKPRDPNKPLKEDAYYYFISERSSKPSIAEYSVGKFWVIGEVQPLTLAELNTRGWTLSKRVKHTGIE